MLKLIGKSKLKKYYLLAAVLLLINLIAFVLVSEYYPIYRLNRATENLNRNGVNESALAEWLASYYDTDFPIIKSNDDYSNDLAFALDTYAANFSDYNAEAYYKLAPLDFIFFQADISQIPIGSKIELNNKLPESVTYTKSQGETGSEIVMVAALGTDNESGRFELEFPVAVTKQMQEQILVQGGSGYSEISKEVSNNIALLTNERDIERKSQVLGLSTEAELENLLETADFSKWEVERIEINYGENKFINNTNILLAKVWLQHQDCNLSSYLNYVHNIESGLSYFADWENFLELNCDVISHLPKISDNYIALTCTDCSFAPLGKSYILPESYNPELENLAGYSEREATPATAAAWGEMAEALKKKILIS